jgi:transposase
VGCGQEGGLFVEKKVLRASEQNRADGKEKRENWQNEQKDWQANRLVFVDETWATTKMTRADGRALIGQRVVGEVAHGHWKTTTFLAALRADGRVAPLVVDGSMTGDLFVAWVQQQLVPTLRRGDRVVMGNLSSHKRVEVRQAIEGVGAEVRYLPPYSPDLNPIEKLFSKLKRLLRTREERTMEGLWKFLGQAVDLFSPNECQNYFRHCGYSP